MVNFNLFLFIIKIMNCKYKNQNKVINYLYKLIVSKYYHIVNVPESVLLKLSQGYSDRIFSNNLFLMHDNQQGLKWYRFFFRCDDTVSTRNVQVLSLKHLPRNCIFCCDSLLYNVKSSFDMLPIDLLSVEIYMKPVSFDLNHAGSIKLAKIGRCDEIDDFILDKAVECYVKSRKFCYLNDLILINISNFTPFKIQKNVCFKIVSADVDFNGKTDGFNQSMSHLRNEATGGSMGHLRNESTGGSLIKTKSDSIDTNNTLTSEATGGSMGHLRNESTGGSLIKTKSDKYNKFINQLNNEATGGSTSHLRNESTSGSLIKTKSDSSDKNNTSLNQLKSESTGGSLIKSKTDSIGKNNTSLNQLKSKSDSIDTNNTLKSEATGGSMSHLRNESTGGSLIKTKRDSIDTNNTSINQLKNEATGGSMHHLKNESTGGSLIKTKRDSIGTNNALKSEATSGSTSHLRNESTGGSAIKTKSDTSNRTDKVINQSRSKSNFDVIGRSTNQSMNEFTYNSIDPLKNQSINELISESIRQLNSSSNLSMSEPIDETECQSTNQTNDLVDSSKNHFIISDKTTIHEVSRINTFLPSIKFDDYYSISTILPLGFKTEYLQLRKKFKPFVKNKQTNGLKPLFVISGQSGIGKSFLLNCLCKHFGMNYVRIDSNDVISSLTNQIYNNVKNVFNILIKSVPCIVDFYNVNLLCYESDGNDFNQVLSILNDFIGEIDFIENRIVIVFTCEDFNLLPLKLADTILDNYQIKLPGDRDRKNLIYWLTNYYCFNIGKNSIDFIVQETSNFNFNDLKKLLLLSDFERYKNREVPIEIDHFKKSLIFFNKENKIVDVISWDDVGGIENVKRVVLSSIETGKLKGLKRTGLLLYGPPGTGKTLLAKAVANEVSHSFIAVKGPELLNMYIGQSEANVRQIFNRARESSPCILFFDELDSLAPNRGNQSSGGVLDRVVSQLLTEIDNINIDDNIFILAATNRPDLIDPALLRPGRLDKTIYVGPFDKFNDKLKVFKTITRKFFLNNDFDYNKIINLLPDEVTGAQISAICYSAWMNSASFLIRNNQIDDKTRVTVSEGDFISALKTTNINF